MKILHVVDYNGVHGGLYLFLRRISEILGDKGVVNFYLARTKPPYEIDDSLTEFDIPVAFEIDVYEYIKSINPDVIHFHDYLNEKQMQWCIQNYPTVRTIHDNYIFCEKGFYKDKAVCKNYSIEKCIHSGCISKNAGEDLLKRLGIQKKFNLITCFSDSISKKCLMYGIDENKVLKIPTLLEKSKSVEFFDGIPSENLIMYAGRIVASKGVEYIIKSLLKIKEKNWKLVLAGTGDKEYVSKLLRLCAEEKIIHKVKFAGYMKHDEYINMLSKAKIFIFSSIAPEGYGYTGAEAMLYGVPIVSFDVEGKEEWLKDGVNGYVVPAGDIDYMAKTIELLLYDNEKWLSIKQGAIELRKQVPKVEEQADYLFQIYESIAKKA